MKTTDFAEHLAVFLTMHLPGQRGLSTNTILSYRDTFKQVLQYAETLGIHPEKLMLTQFNADFVEAFLAWLEKERGCGRGTRNQRLAAIHSFARYVHSKRPEYLFESQKIMDIRSKKRPEPQLPFLTPDTIRAVLSQPDMSTKYGRRDAVLLSLMYDSAARVQELCDLRVRDVRLHGPYTVTLTGKGAKIRSVPIMSDTAALLKKYVVENKMTTTDKYDYPLFQNHQHSKLTRAGVAYILKKYCDSARKHFPHVPVKLSPHVFARHSKAMHMLQAGVNLVYIRDFLGHVNISTTEIYSRADAESKRAAIEKAAIKVTSDLPDWAQDKSLMAILTNICATE
jgi:site-specific recombinase XerD